jgi:probable HAF family extracellular repeat protein
MNLPSRAHFGAPRKYSAFDRILILVLPFCFGVVACGGGSGGGLGVNPPPATFATIDVPGAGTASGRGTYSLRINDAGELAGYFIDANGVGHGFIRAASGTVTTIDAPGAGATEELGTVVEDINASGETAGYFIDSQDLQHSFFRDANGAITTFDPAGASGAQSIGDDGTVAGGYVDANGAHGYLRAPNGAFTTFDPTGDASQVKIVVPERINSDGSVAGTYTDTNGVFHGFLRDSNGNITILDAPGAGTASGEGTEIADINAGGAMVGGINIGVVNGVDTTHCVLRSAGGYTIFDPPEAQGVSSFAEGINASGTITGTFRDPSLVRHGFVEQPGGSFASFDAPGAAQLPLSNVNVGTTALRINANGVVVGYFSDSAGVRHGFTYAP